MLHKHARPAVAGSYWAGTTSGAALTAAALLLFNGLLSPIPANIRATLFVLVVALLGLHVSRLLCLPLPERRYQIPRETFEGTAPAAAFRFAFELGLGFRTYIPAASPYGVAAALVLVTSGTLSHAVLVAGATAVGFGAGRARIVSTHVLSRTPAIEHPAGWLRVADVVALAAIATVGVRAFV